MGGIDFLGLKSQTRAKKSLSIQGTQFHRYYSISYIRRYKVNNILDLIISVCVTLPPTVRLLLCNPTKLLQEISLRPNLIRFHLWVVIQKKDEDASQTQ